MKKLVVANKIVTSLTRDGKIFRAIFRISFSLSFKQDYKAGITLKCICRFLVFLPAHATLVFVSERADRPASQRVAILSCNAGQHGGGKAVAATR